MDIFHSLNYLEGLERITVKNEVWFANILSFKNMLVFFFFGGSGDKSWASYLPGRYSHFSATPTDL
jgi:hypothetical protein